MIKQKRKTIKSILLDIRRMLKWFLSGEGALVTLTLLVIAAVLGFLIQDAIQKQRYLELLQLELRTNYANSNSEIKNVLNKHYLTSRISLNTSVYNAGLQQGYILTINNPATQAELYSLYTIYFPEMNSLQNHYMDVINQYENRWEACEDNSIVLKQSDSQCNQLKEDYLAIQKQYSIYIAQGDAQIVKAISQVTFNPTDERIHPKTLGGWILNILMHSESLKIQQ